MSVTIEDEFVIRQQVGGYVVGTLDIKQTIVKTRRISVLEIASSTDTGFDLKRFDMTCRIEDAHATTILTKG